MPDHTLPWADLPHGDAINALLDELRTLSPDEARAMAYAWGAVPEAAWRVAGRAAEDAAWDADAVRVAAVSAAGRAAGGIARGAALALVVADLAGQYGLTRDHLYVLAAPARTIPRLAEIIDRALPTKEN